MPGQPLADIGRGRGGADPPIPGDLPAGEEALDRLDLRLNRFFSSGTFSPVELALIPWPSKRAAWRARLDNQAWTALVW
jgi:hypothetical protein